MAVETLFRLANFAAVIAWAVLLAAALFGWRRALERFCGTVAPLLLAAAYVVVIAASWGGKVDLGSLAGISAVFQQPAAALAGWLHYLAFDMLIGVMLARRMMEDAVPRLVMAPVLLLTFFFGPAGFLLFHGVRLARSGLAAPAAPGRPAKARRSPAPKA